MSGVMIFSRLLYSSALMMAMLMLTPAQASGQIEAPNKTANQEQDSPESPETESEESPPLRLQVPRGTIMAPDDLARGEPASRDDTLEGVLNTGPDYSNLTPKAEQKARLDSLFERLKAEKDSDAAALIAEEIWALWLDSGSATVDLILLRGTAFEKRGETALARRMYDHVMTLMPDYAEGWARSARLAMEEEDLNRALSDAAQALILEPREFYALWTMGNVLEKLSRTREAFEIYSEAIKIYPEHPAIKARVETLKSQIDGDVL